MKKRTKIRAFLFTLAVLSCFLFASFSFSQELLLPKPGTVIDKNNYKTYAHLFPKEYLQGFEDGFGGLWKPFVIKVIETKPVPKFSGPQKYLDFSEKNRGKYAFDARGTVSGGWDVQGFPFPEVTPADKDFAQKLMWNFGYAWGADSNDVDCANMLKRKGEAVRIMQFAIDGTRFTSRLYEKPGPLIPTPEGLQNSSVFWYKTPPSMKNFQQLQFTYIDPTKYNDAYIYLPQMRRVVRAETGQMSTPMAGTLQAPDDFFGGFSGKPFLFTYKLLGEQKVLGCMRATTNFKTWALNRQKEEQDYIPYYGDDWEVRDVYLIEILSKDPNYPASKKIIYLDKEARKILYGEMWDRAGKPWKMFSNWWSVHPLAPKKNVQDPVLESVGMLGIELQFGMGTIWSANNNLLQGYTKEDFTTSSLVKRAQ
jgi:hypothetical protein